MYHLQAQCVLLKGFTFHTYFVIWSGPQRSPPSSHPGIHMPGQDVKGFLFHSQPKQDLWFDTYKTAEYSTLFCIVYQNCCTSSTVTDSSTGQFSSSTSETCHFLPPGTASSYPDGRDCRYEGGIPSSGGVYMPQSLQIGISS